MHGVLLKCCCFKFAGQCHFSHSNSVFVNFSVHREVNRYEVNDGADQLFSDQHTPIERKQIDAYYQIVLNACIKEVVRYAQITVSEMVRLLIIDERGRYHQNKREMTDKRK